MVSRLLKKGRKELFNVPKRIGMTKKLCFFGMYFPNASAVFKGEEGQSSAKSVNSAKMPSAHRNASAVPPQFDLHSGLHLWLGICLFL